LGPLTLADVEVQADAFVEFFFLGILSKDRLEEACGLLVGVALERLEAALINGDSFEIRGGAGAGGGGGGGSAASASRAVRAEGGCARAFVDRGAGRRCLAINAVRSAKIPLKAG